MRIIQEILAVSIDGVSKTKAVTRTNLNFSLIGEYLEFLTSSGYVDRIRISIPTKFKLTVKGRGLLRMLVQLDREIGGFRMKPTRNGERAIAKGTKLPPLRSGGPQTLGYSSEEKSQRFTQNLNAQTFVQLNRITKERGTSLQELFRAVIVPEWLKKNNEAITAQ